MRLEPVAVSATRVSRWSAIALGASLPVSTALDNVLLVLIVAAWALSGQIRGTVKILFKNKYLRYSILLFALLALGTLYGESPWREAFASLGKYADLLCIPVFATVFQQRDTRVAPTATGSNCMRVLRRVFGHPPRQLCLDRAGIGVGV